MSAQPDSLVLIYTTYPDAMSASDAARALVSNRLAACVTMTPQQSVYTWQERLQEDHEILLTIKTLNGCSELVHDWIKANHPYEIPEFVTVTAASVDDAYGQWARNSLKLHTIIGTRNGQ